MPGDVQPSLRERDLAALDAAREVITAWDTWVDWMKRAEIPVPAGSAPFHEKVEGLRKALRP